MSSNFEADWIIPHRLVGLRPFADKDFSAANAPLLAQLEAWRHLAPLALIIDHRATPNPPLSRAALIKTLPLLDSLYYNPLILLLPESAKTLPATDWNSHNALAWVQSAGEAFRFLEDQGAIEDWTNLNLEFLDPMPARRKLPTTLSISRARAEHAEGIGRLLFASHYYNYRSFADPHWVATRLVHNYIAEWQAYFEDPLPGIRYYVAQSEGRVLGMMGLQRLHLWRFYQIALDYCEDPDLCAAILGGHVLPEYRRVGLGTRLYERVMQEARLSGTQCLYVAVLWQNQAGRGFADKYGWDMVKILPETGGDIILNLRL